MLYQRYISFVYEDRRLLELFIDPNLDFLRRAQKNPLVEFLHICSLRALRRVSAYYAEYPSLSHFIIRGWILCVYAQNITSGVDFFRARPQIFHACIVWIYLAQVRIHVVLCVHTQNRKSGADFFCVRPQTFHACVTLFGMSAYVRRKSEMTSSHNNRHYRTALARIISGSTFRSDL